jgi:hypothetical protein
MNDIWLKALRRRYTQFKNIKYLGNDELRRRGYSFNERLRILERPKVVAQWMEDLKGYARLDPPKIPERWKGKEEEYYFYNYWHLIPDIDEEIETLQTEFNNYLHAK